MGVNRTPKTPITAKEIEESELYGVLLQAAGETKDIGETQILQKLFAAEDFYERALAMKFKKTRVFSDPVQRKNHPDAVMRANVQDYDELTDLADPAYDFEPGMWRESRSAMIKLRHRPVNKVDRIIFSWFDAGHAWDVPTDWLVWDGMGGTVQISPRSGQAAIMGFGNFLLTNLAMGRGVPHAIYIDYQVGFGNDLLCMHHNDLLEGVRLRTLLGLAGTIIGIAMPGGQTGGSLGMDGLSESRSFSGKFGPYSGKIQLAMEQEMEIRANWETKEQGVPVVFA